MINSKYEKPKYYCPECGARGRKLGWFCLTPGHYYWCESCRRSYFVPDELQGEKKKEATR